MVVEMIKQTLGARLHCKNIDSKTTEILSTVLCHNIYVVIRQMYELGLEPEFVQSETVQKNNARHSGIT
jgi:hypothetical protein